MDTAERPTILLVDDQERNLDALEAILDTSGYELVRARSADEALMALLNRDFAAIVCDIRMPGIGGIELAQMIKQRKRTQHIPILFLTAHTAEEADLLLGYGAGAADYISKPINPEILRLKIGVFAELFRKTRALARANQSLASEVLQRKQAQEELRAAKEGLEHRVQERTAELLAANRALSESEDRLIVAKEAAEAANRSKDHFLAVLSHELRTPLTPVLATLQGLLGPARVSPELRESLDLIHRNVELEARLIDDLLDLTRIARGKMELFPQPVNLHRVVEHAVRTCQIDFECKQITVHISMRADAATVQGDRARLLQVLWNVLKNAAKFTPPGNRVDVMTSNPSEGLLRIEVRDTGVGIEAEKLASIFNAFEQGDNSVTRQFGGLGLGLSISKALVDLHGGTITATSDGPNQGAILTIELPLAAEDQSDETPHFTDQPMVGFGDSRGGEAGVRILLVEDHPDTSKVLQKLLLRVGYDVTVADGLQSTLATLAGESRPFDVLVSDIGLPDGSGLDLMREMRNRSPQTIGIALSGFGMEDDRRRSIEAGFHIHLTKPVDLSALQSAIEHAVAVSTSCET